MALHQEFENAGKTPGLMVWRIEKGDLVPVPKNLYGNFYTGDAYLLLYTTPGFSYRIHMWIGKECSVNERGGAAIFATQMDDHFDGKPVQHQEPQGKESTTFQSYFPNGLKYMEGGVDSGFQHVVTNQMDMKRLLHVKGRRFPRATEVPFSWASFNQGDCFVIDAGADIYQWIGSSSGYTERLKAGQIGMHIRDNERGGRAKFHSVQEDSEGDDLIKLLGTKPKIPSESDSDCEADMANRKKAKLYMVSDASGKLKLTEVASQNPFSMTLLSTNESYILDNGQNGKIFLWKGKGASAEERKKGLIICNEFITTKNYPNDTQIEVVPEYGETSLFKQFFNDWKEKDQTKGLGKVYTIGSTAVIQPIPFDISKLHGSQTMAAQHGMVDDGSGTIQIWRIEGNAKQPVDSSLVGQFFGGDCYIILYSYLLNNSRRHIIYTWQGLKATQDELGTSAFLTVQLDQEMGDLPVQVRVTQGQEPAHLMSLFKGKPIIVHSGGTSRKGGQTAPAPVRLFHIRKTSNGANRAVEVNCDAESLNTNDSFVLKTSKQTYIWKGVGASDAEVDAAKYVVSVLGGSETVVKEGSEPGDFWQALGGKKKYQTSVALSKETPTHPIRLFGCSNKTGRFTIEEVPGDFTQLDLAVDDVMLLDTWDQVFLWIGKDANEVEKSKSEECAREYIATDPQGRDKGTPIVIVKQGNEPPTFTGWFLAWDPSKWDLSPLQKAMAKLQSH
uniref:Gelsolin-like protein n=1 Tax=Callorhinchus milii TaxID=7868 RepID=V9KFV0_CALMI